MTVDVQRHWFAVSASLALLVIGVLLWRGERVAPSQPPPQEGGVPPRLQAAPTAPPPTSPASESSQPRIANVVADIDLESAPRPYVRLTVTQVIRKPWLNTVRANGILARPTPSLEGWEVDVPLRVGAGVIRLEYWGGRHFEEEWLGRDCRTYACKPTEEYAAARSDLIARIVNKHPDSSRLLKGIRREPDHRDIPILSTMLLTDPDGPLAAGILRVFQEWRAVDAIPSLSKLLRQRPDMQEQAVSCLTAIMGQWPLPERSGRGWVPAESPADEVAGYMEKWFKANRKDLMEQVFPADCR